MKRLVWSELGIVAIIFCYLLLAIWPISWTLPVIPSCYQSGTETKNARSTDWTVVPNLNFLYQQSSVGQILSEQQLAEERAIDAEQVEQARIWLNDADPAQRVTGAEQLAAYPTSTAETYLLDALHDPNEQVRAAAANSLAAFREPSAGTYDALIRAMQDGDEEVRFNAWSTLGIFLNRVDFPPKSAKKIHGQLTKLLKQGRFVDDIEDGVREYLRDQESN